VERCGRIGGYRQEKLLSLFGFSQMRRKLRRKACGSIVTWS